MSFGPRLRKSTLTVHVVASVGWLGAVIAFLGLSIIGFVSHDAAVVNAVRVALYAGGWSVLVPLSVASLLSGILQSLGTPWGLLRHYWVVVKLWVNVLASVVLVLYMQTLASLAQIARVPGASPGYQAASALSPVIHSAGALLLLVVATILSVFKPRGRTRYGQAKASRGRPRAGVDVL